ncbi:GSCOCG00006111001-RA-CDS, partial [Cotesia congregata]
MGAPVIFVFVLAITAQSVYSHVGLSREGVIEQDKNPEHTSNIKVDDINKENSAKESPVSGSNFYHGSSSFSFGQNKKVEQQSEVEVKFYEESHPVKSCSVSCTCAP